MNTLQQKQPKQQRKRKTVSFAPIDVNQKAKTVTAARVKPPISEPETVQADVPPIVTTRTTPAETEAVTLEWDPLAELLNMMEQDNDLILTSYEDTQPAIDVCSPQSPAPQQTSPMPEGSQYWPPSYEPPQAIPRSLQGEDTVNEKDHNIFLEMVYTTGTQGKQDANTPGTDESADPGIESIIEQAGGFGRFQKLFLLVYNFLLPCAMGMNYVNVVMALTAPDHWCHVPGREEANLTLDQWKALTVPRKGKSYSRCTMYSDTGENSHITGSFIEENTTGCQFGWEYDNTWYTMTAVSQHNWVCIDDIKASIALSLSSLGQAVGLLVFGQLSDIVGRRPVFHVAAACVLVGRVGCIFCSDTYWLFAAAIFLGGTSYGACYSTTLTLAGELVPGSKRGLVTMTQLTGWAAGHMAAPMVALLLPDWRHFTAVTAISVAPFLLVCWWFPESPRWLAVHGRPDRALSQLQAIARCNGCALPPHTEAALQKLASRREAVYGIASLFATRSIAITSTLTCIAGTTMMVLYDSTLLTMTSAVDNSPVLNLMVQAAIEVPAYVAGRLASDRLGRKPALYCCLLALAVLNTCSAAIAGWEVVWAEMSLLALSKACICAAFCPLHVLALETFPTCLRQTGISFYTMLGSAASVASPYLVFQGQNKDVQIPYLVMSALASIGSLPAFFLNETRKRQLPETLADVKRKKNTIKIRKISAPDLTADYVSSANGVEVGNSQCTLP